MSLTAHRLQQLRQQAGTAPAGPAARTQTNPGRVQPAGVTIDALRHLLGTRGRMQASQEITPPARAGDRALPGEQIHPGLFYIERTLPWVQPCQSIVVDAKTHGPIEPCSAMCFDTETTGLAGGAGTRTFMVGISQWTADGLRVRQLLTATLGAEAAMLRTLADWIEPGHVLVSYNGRCYDSPSTPSRHRVRLIAETEAIRSSHANARPSFRICCDRCSRHYSITARNRYSFTSACAIGTPPMKCIEKAPTGVIGFDEITAGGLPRGRTTLLGGSAGSGKTIFSLQFLVHGVSDFHENGIFVAFEETAARIVTNSGGFGWDLARLRQDNLFFIDAQPTPDLVE